jgi:hypothetical protein
MTYTKKELLKNAAPYFAQGAKVMYATSDGNFFYPSQKHYAVGHQSISKTELFELTKEDFKELDENEPDDKLKDAQKALEKAQKALEKAKTPDAKEKAEFAVLEAQELIDKIKTEAEGQ